MSWIQKLYETYENCQSMIGAGSDDNEVPLLPICHTTQKAHVEIVIDQNGDFVRARVIPKNESRTVIPCTEKSGGRTSGEAAHPLCDKLQYVAEDYKKYGGEKKSYHKSYITQLDTWCQSAYKHPKVLAVSKYVKKGTVVKDLISHKVLHEKGGKLLKKWEGDKKERPIIFSLFQNQEWQAEAFVRWDVETPGEPDTKVWNDNTLWESWIKYYLSTKKNKTLCYVTGKEQLIADQHPRKIRNDGDGAKLISSGKTVSKKGEEKVDDPTGFTFLGRFVEAEQACGVSLEASQKAHHALRWLISRQGYRKGGQAIVAWATSGSDIPQPTDDAVSILGEDDLPSDESPIASTAQELAIKLRKKIAGYGKELGNTTGVVVMGLDSATPGRMAITYYRELTGSDFLQKIENWHESCAWIHNYRHIEVQDQESSKKKKKYMPFVGAPAPSDIAEAVYGNRVDDKLRKATVERILPCIIDGQQIPRDIVESAVRRASNRIGMEDWEWNKTLSITCALLKNYNRKEKYDMALDLKRKTRDYLYGRLLALADSLEQWALNKAGEDRQTNAARLMNRFSEHPYSAWRNIELSLGPYKARLGGKSKKRQKMIDEVIALFEHDDFMNDKKLSGEFLLGYHCQREYIRNIPEQEVNSNNNSNEISNKQ